MDVRLSNDYTNYINAYVSNTDMNLNTDDKKINAEISQKDLFNNEGNYVYDKNGNIEVAKTEEEVYTETYDKKDLDKAINKLNKFLEDENTHAEYSKHKDLGTLMIKIVSDKDEKVIMELPPEKILNMIASLCKQVGIIDEKA